MEHFLGIAARISTPWSLAAFAIAAVLLVLRTRSKVQNMVRTAAIVAVVMLGLVPIVAPLYLQSRTVYRVRVIVLDLNHSPVNDAQVTCSLGGEPKRIEGGWEFDIPDATRASNGKLTIYAAVKNAFLTGQAETILASDSSPTVTLQLSKDTSATIRGIVLTSTGHPVRGAHVGVVGYESEAVETQEGGNFSLPAHAANRQQVQLYANRVGFASATMWSQAGDVPVTIVLGAAY